jgi:spoIIIJ-associated protein
MSEKISQEFVGKTVEQAIKKALKELKLPRHKLKIEVLSEEEKGLFGMPGAKPAKIRVSCIKGKEETSEKLFFNTNSHKSNTN